MKKHGSTERESGGCQPRLCGFDMLLLSISTICPVTVHTQMKRSLFSICSFGAYFIAYLPKQDSSQISKSAETKPVFTSQGTECFCSVSGLLIGNYFLTFFIMNNIHISNGTASMAVRALYCYKRIIGLGADLHGDMPDRTLLKQIDSAAKEILDQTVTKKELETTKRLEK